MKTLYILAVHDDYRFEAHAFYSEVERETGAKAIMKTEWEGVEDNEFGPCPDDWRLAHEKFQKLDPSFYIDFAEIEIDPEKLENTSATPA